MGEGGNRVPQIRFQAALRPRPEALGVLHLRVDQAEADPVDQEVAREDRVAAVLPLASSVAALAA